MEKIIGIDLGTTNSVVSVIDLGMPVVIPDSEGRRLTPSVVSYTDPDTPLVGVPALRQLAVHPTDTITSVKRFMGRRGGEIQDEDMPRTYTVVGKDDAPLKVVANGVALRPEEVSAQILKKLKADAERYLGEVVSRAVITVPAYFNDAQRAATKQAGEIAGLTVERIVNEPTAACLAYGMEQIENGTVAVYDLGGGTFDISIVEVNDKVFKVLSTCGNTRLGGDDFDHAVMEWLKLRCPDPQIFSNPMVQARLKEAAEAAKCDLSDKDEVEISIPFLAGDFSLSATLSRDTFESLIAARLDETRTACLQALSDAGLSDGGVDTVILVGGSSRIPLVRKLVSRVFGKAPETNVNPDEAVALGAAVQAGILAGGVSDTLLLDVTPLSLGIETFGGLMNVIIPRNTTIPTKAGELFTTAVDDQTAVNIHVLQGEREMVADNWTLGRFSLPVDPAKAGTPRVGVQFTIDADGILHVLARDTITGKEQQAQIKAAADISDDEVEQMVRQSVEHAQEDILKRQLVEAQISGEEMLRATQQALEDYGDQLAPADRAKIDAAWGDTRRAIDADDLVSLKEAKQALDEATQKLADIMFGEAVKERTSPKSS
ncbi:MAG: molecular chaperone DnaK [Leptospirillia bacterium]